jgi:hypothetical protein
MTTDKLSHTSTPGDIFATTHWTVVLAAGRRHTPQSDRALEELCRSYWFPLYAYVRRRWKRATARQHDRDWENQAMPGLHVFYISESVFIEKMNNVGIMPLTEADGNDGALCCPRRGAKQTATTTDDSTLIFRIGLLNLITAIH